MASGFRKKGGDEYVFVNGRAMRPDEAALAPGQLAPGQAQVAPANAPGGSSTSAPAQANVRQEGRRKVRSVVSDMESDDALAIREDALSDGGYVMGGEPLLQDDRRKMRRLYLVFGFVLLACFSVSCCADLARLSFRSPVEVVQGLATWVSLQFTAVFDSAAYADARLAALTDAPEFSAVAYQFANTAKYAVCGVMLAVSGMLYQNAFRNPIAAPSMLGVTNGINFAVLVLVMQFGWNAYQHLDLYYLYSYLGGAIVLALVMLGGRWTSGHRKFNVVNMILVGTIASQLLGVIITFVENNFMSDLDWLAYNQLVQAADVTSVWTYVSLVVGGILAFVPVFLFRFRLNLVSFSDEETTFLGANPNKLRILALASGSLMILTAQVNAGQVAMISLVVPFVVRAVFGSEFRKQLGGNILVGAILLIVCGLLSDYIIINYEGIGLAAVTTFIAMPLFVWMLAIRQRSWD